MLPLIAFEKDRSGHAKKIVGPYRPRAARLRFDPLKKSNTRVDWRSAIVSKQISLRKNGAL
jgi:hypothetical protein